MDGLLGWRVVTRPDGSVRGEDLAGRAVTVPAGQEPVAALVLPGDERPRAVLGNLALLDPDGVASAVAGVSGQDYTPGAVPLPGPDFLGNLLPRDPAGSTALRRIDRDAVAGLLAAAVDERRAQLADAAATQAAASRPGATAPARAGGPATTAPDPLVALIRSAVPAISHDALLAGVAGVLRMAARVRTDLDAATGRLTRALSAPAQAPVATAAGPTDRRLSAALDGLRGTAYGEADLAHAFPQFQALDAQRSATGGVDPGVRLHIDGPVLPGALHWWPVLDSVAAVAYRAVAAVTPDEQREDLAALLTELDRLDLTTATEPARWRRLRLHLLDDDLNDAQGKRRHPRPGILPLPDGAFLAVHAASGTRTGYHLDALYHDPAGVFAVPEPYTVDASTPVGDARPAGWLARFRTEWAARGPLPWRPEAAERFAELTGVTPTAAKLVLAGLPHADSATPV
ncbi:hypothetical protein QLR68_19460, partial [Micromonospora sp. DH15]|nr:hypothetical protein [Micromonospora sp. DH15]